MNLIDQLKTNLENASTEKRAFDDAKWKGILYPELSWELVGAAIEVHKHIGPGQLESVYQAAMEIELRQRQLDVRRQAPVQVRYKGEPVGNFRADLIVEDSVILELNAVDKLTSVHTAQLLSYLDAAKLRLGILMNFHVPRMIQGIKRIVR